MFEVWDEEVWEEIRLSPQEFIDAGDQVAFFNTNSAAAAVAAWRSSPKPQSSSSFVTGKVTRIQGFIDQEQALEPPGCWSR